MKKITSMSISEHIMRRLRMFLLTSDTINDKDLLGKHTSISTFVEMAITEKLDRYHNTK